MKAIGYTHAQFGLPIENPNALAEIPLPDPAPQGRDILVEVRAVSVNPVDTKVRRGSTPAAGEVKVLGWDAVGVVRATGSDVSLFKPGDRVWYAGSIARPGSNCQLHLVDERIVGHAPKSLDDAEAAALPLTGLTAWELLFDRLQIAPGTGTGQSILIVGAGGGVGSILVQLARQLTQLTVIGTASRPETVDWVRNLGAHHVIDYRREDVAARVRELTEGEGVHHVVDVDFGGNLAATLACVRLNGSIAYYATKGAREPVVPAGAMMGLNLQVSGVYLPVSPHEARRRAQADITRWIGTGERILSVAGRFPLEDCAGAHELVESGGKVGTVVVEP